MKCKWSRQEKLGSVFVIYEICQYFWIRKFDCSQILVENKTIVIFVFIKVKKFFVFYWQKRCKVRKVLIFFVFGMFKDGDVFFDVYSFVYSRCIFKFVEESGGIKFG